MFTVARSRYSAIVMALVFVAQLLAQPFHHPIAQSKSSVIVAQLRATFGETPALCIHDEDPGAPAAPLDRSGHCDDECPLCQFGAQAAALVAPPTPVLPDQMDIGSNSLGFALVFGSIKPTTFAFPQPRAPPFNA